MEGLLGEFRSEGSVPGGFVFKRGGGPLKSVMIYSKENGTTFQYINFSHRTLPPEIVFINCETTRQAGDSIWLNTTRIS